MKSTAINRHTASKPLRWLLKNELIPCNASICDFGCGLGADLRHLDALKYYVTGYDPVHYPNPELRNTKYDIVLCTYVLNVVPKSDEIDLLFDILLILERTGTAFLSVRRDVKHDGETTRGYQRLVKLPFEPIFEDRATCIYRVEYHTLLDYIKNNTVITF